MNLIIVSKTLFKTTTKEYDTFTNRREVKMLSVQAINMVKVESNIKFRSMSLLINSKLHRKCGWENGVTGWNLISKTQYLYWCE